jgi:hypothetical protein
VKGNCAGGLVMFAAVNCNFDAEVARVELGRHKPPKHSIGGCGVS